MNACIRFCCSSGMPIVSMAVFAVYIFFSRYMLREFSSLTSTASSPNKLAKTMAPKKLKNAALVSWGTPRGSKSLPIKKRQLV